MFLTRFQCCLVLSILVAPSLVSADEACCFAPSGCVDTDPVACGGAGGIARGPGSTCATAGCSGQGGCCQLDSSCDDGLSQFICENGGGAYHGDGKPCLADEGVGNTCTDGVDNDCDGDFDCDDPGCAVVCLGSCCQTDGSCDNSMSPTDCAAGGGTYNGHGSLCVDQNCPQPDGACCLTNLSCLDLTDAECSVVPNSGWAGPFTACGGTFPAGEDEDLTCCDGLDNDCDGLTDAADGDCAAAICLQPLLSTNDCSKNRYISFVPTNPGVNMAIRVELTASAFEPAAVGFVGWIGAPDNNRIARVVLAPVFRIWNEPAVYAGDCEIMPAAAYELRATDGVSLSPPLMVPTAASPGAKPWGDTVGVFDGMAWTCPNGTANANDFVAGLQRFLGLSTAPHVSRVDVLGAGVPDPCQNKIGSISDVFLIIKAFQGDDYPFETNPALCPICP